VDLEAFAAPERPAKLLVRSVFWDPPGLAATAIRSAAALRASREEVRELEAQAFF
jgi:hypothetical protein